MADIAALIRFARKVVEQVRAQLAQQLNVVQDQVFNPMQAMVQEVMGGVWIGQGADAFVDEVTSLVIPGVGRIADRITTLDKNVQHAVDVIDQADEQVNTAVNSLADVFDNIYH